MFGMLIRRQENNLYLLKRIYDVYNVALTYSFFKFSEPL